MSTDNGSSRRDGRWLMLEAPELLTLPDVAEITGRDRKTVVQMLDEGLLPFVRVGARRFVQRTALLRFVGLPVPVAETAA